MNDSVNEPNDVEDVLASIRKLVSEEVNSQAERAAPEPLVLTPAQKADPLVLTPSQELEKKPAPLVLGAQAKVEPTTAVRPEPVAAVKPPEPVAKSEPVQSEAPISDTQTPDAPFQDEVALRALVAEMIREELSGELGNRITHNVRKLIRREIEIAMQGKA